ncbi:MAG TPA: hypothetical protein VKT28_15465 [Puia sp.]|nr:hypothetical protein [Puia sp.]
MKIAFALFTIILFSNCGSDNASSTQKTTSPIVGSWKLISGTIIQKGDTAVTDYTKDKSFIKIINETHFAFLLHDLKKGKDSATASFAAGGGRCEFTDSTYTEHLEYCSDRTAEGHDFSFHITISNDTLTQSGIEKIEEKGYNVLNTEKYVRIK